MPADDTLPAGIASQKPLTKGLRNSARFPPPKHTLQIVDTLAGEQTSILPLYSLGEVRNGGERGIRTPGTAFGRTTV